MWLSIFISGPGYSFRDTIKRTYICHKDKTKGQCYDIRNTNEAILLVEAGGYDVVLVETVGMGQSE